MMTTPTRITFDIGEPVEHVYIEREIDLNGELTKFYRMNDDGSRTLVSSHYEPRIQPQSFWWVHV